MNVFESKKTLAVLFLIALVALGLVLFIFTQRPRTLNKETPNVTQVPENEFSKQISELLNTSNLLFEGEIKAIDNDTHVLTVASTESTEKSFQVRIDPFKTIIFVQPLTPSDSYQEFLLQGLKEGMHVLIYGSKSTESSIVAAGISVRVQPTIDFRRDTTMKNGSNSGSPDQ